MPTPREHATTMLDRLIELDQIVNGHCYEMGQILSAIEHGKLWEVLEYQSFAHLVQEELSFSDQTAYNYMHLYRGLRRLKYTKLESLALIRRFGMWRMLQYLRTAKTKESTRAITKAIQKIRENTRTVAFSLSKDEYAAVMDLLHELGLEHGPSGRATNLTETFLQLVDLVKERGVKQAA